MHITSITLEGFKSYGNRTVISGFDPFFNAITGLNGSGKSNILDSICFVLGISKLEQVRATNMNELVYKNGQAGINRATVSITFDNSDKSASPMGYETHKEITITRSYGGGKNKYFINGASSNNNRVHDLFQSVQLNVNNPHFLIMQGRITKVLNMKPLEILSMIEEAAGTRMYEDKKELALKSLEKKESRLREIATMLNEHIVPQLEKLKEERKEYTEYTRVLRDYERLSKLYIAWDYLKTEEAITATEEEKEKLRASSEELKNSIVQMKEKIVECDNKISENEKKMDGEGGNKLKELEEQLKKLQVSETKADTHFRNLKEAFNEETKKNAELIKNLKEEKSTLALKEKEYQNSGKKLEDLKAAADADKDAIAAAENHYHAVNAGLSGEDGEEASLAAQLITANKDKKDAETEGKSIEMSLKHMKEELEKKQSEIKKVDKSYSQDMAEYKNFENEINKLKNDISKLNYGEGSFERLIAEERALCNETERLKDQLDAVFARHPQLSFDYADPVKGFDRSKVIGPLCLQIEIVDPKYAVALDMVAGGRLNQIIVDNEDTGKLLLSKGNFGRRVTVIPLNKIKSSSTIDNRTVAAAQKLVGKENVIPALSCIRFDQKLTPAMEYAFGSTFICKNMESAKKVTFDKDIRKRSVTLEGEVFDPSGTLSGGSMGNRGKLLAELAPVAKIRKNIENKQNQLNEMRSKIQQIKRVKERYDGLCEKCELLENDARNVKNRIEHSNHHKQLEELQKLKNSLEEQKNLLAECKVKQTKAEKLIKELAAKTSKSTREAKIKEAEKAVANCKKKAAASQEKYNSFLAEVNGLKLEIEGIKDGLPELEESIENSAKTVETLKNQMEEYDKERNTIKESVANMSKEVKSYKDMMRAHSSEINKISKEKEQLNKKIANAELQIQQLEHDIKNSGDNCVDAKNKMKHLLENYRWIESQKKYFGVPNSEFDFQNFNAKQAHSQIKQLEEIKNRLGKNVNTKAQNMLANVEEQYKDLITKRTQVLKDKEAIEDVIKKLDKQTKTALVNACAQVNKDFGSIFRTLLPGTNAKLVPQQGKTVLEGLEFKVAFGDVWKESLSELSGGQRSLVALSLILSLLLFNPAPIYILDEVDAALDLSHTQNIGKMLKMHFTKSQFIVVSLKDGMFNNANVLFRTKFSDGMSSVSRTCQQSR